MLQRCFLKRHRKAQPTSTAVNNVTEQPDTVSSRQRAGCTPGSCALRVYDTAVCVRLADGAAGGVIFVATKRVSRSPSAATAYVASRIYNSVSLGVNAV